MKTKWTIVFLGHATLFTIMTIWCAFNLGSWLASDDVLTVITGILIIFACIAMVYIGLMLAWIAEKLS